jgi:hypothetical protein
MDLAVTTQPGYLGNAAVVEKLVRELIGGALESLDQDDIARRATAFARVFAGMDTDHPPVPEWDTIDGIGMSCATRLGVSSEQNLVDIMRSSALAIVAVALDVVKAHAEDAGAVWQPKIDDVVTYAVSALMGLPQ